MTVGGVPYQLASGSGYVGNDSILLTANHTSQDMLLDTLGAYSYIYVLGTAGGPGSGNYANFNIKLTYTDDTVSTTSYKLYDWYDSYDVTGVVKDPRLKRANGWGSSSTTGGPYIQSATIEANPSKLLKTISFEMTGKNSSSNMSGLYCGVYAVTGMVSADAPETPVISDANAATKSISVSWNSVTGATAYTVDVATDPYFAHMLTGYNNKNVGEATSITVKGLSRSTTYYCRVRALKNNLSSLSSEVAELHTGSHVHTWSYSVEDSSKIVATCTCPVGIEGCEYTAIELTASERKVSLTLAATTTAYTGSVTGIDAFNEATELTVSENSDYIKFYKVTRPNVTSGGNEYAATDSPEVGYYYAALTVEGKTAVKAFTIGSPSVPVTAVSLNKEAITLYKGNTETLTATVTPDDATNKAVKWSSNKKEVASVDENGKVTAVAAGTATITVTTVDGGKTASCTVTVKEAYNYEDNSIKLNSKIKLTLDKNAIVEWGAVPGADKYEIYIAYCGKTGTPKLVKTVKGSVTKTTIKKIDDKAINQSRLIKVYVVAIKTIDGKKTKIGKSILVHASANNSARYTNAKKVTVKNTSVTLKIGKSTVIKATTVKADSTKKLLVHENEFRYASTNTKVAQVSEKGKIIAKGKGSCYIYVYAINGSSTKVKVTVN